MPRMKRLDLGGVVQHLVQRGDGRQARFPGSDYIRDLRDLREVTLKHGCRSMLMSS